MVDPAEIARWLTKDCPMCGSTATAYYRPSERYENSAWVSCDSEDCGTQTCFWETREQAIAAWNRRADA